MINERFQVPARLLADLIQEAGEPVHVNRLARAALSAWLAHGAGQRPYAPGATFQPGERIVFNGRSATITALQPGANPLQGQFQVLTLTFDNGRTQHVAAGISGAPCVAPTAVDADAIEQQWNANGRAWRTTVTDALSADERFVHFADEHGDLWCLADYLPTVTADEKRNARDAIRRQTTDPYAAVQTADLVAAIWGLTDDGSARYQLHYFALNCALDAVTELQYVAGAGWMSRAQWQRVLERPSLVSPRQPNTVPTPPDDGDQTEPPAVPQPDPPADEPMADRETWRQERLDEVTITLQANHYYYHWLPLTKPMARHFPSWPCRVTIHHHFGDKPAQFRAVVDPAQKRILAERALYDACYNHAIYPGAKLVLTHRGGEYEYDIRTQPVAGGQTILVHRIERGEDGHIKQWTDEEPLRYAVDGDVFVASARYEDLPALFQQADEVGKGIFTLMFAQCQAWQRERGTPLLVTADELFTAIHTTARMTSKATILWELWRRRAFEALGNGRYRFLPDQGVRRRSYGHATPQSRPSTSTRQTTMSPTPPRTAASDTPRPRLSSPKHPPSKVDSTLSPDPPFRTPLEVRQAALFAGTEADTFGPLFGQESDTIDPCPPATGYFLLQQKPRSDYDDQTGVIYNWRQGIPGSKQLQPGARFIYYRPGAKLFFGAGCIARIETRKDGNGRFLYDGHIANYQQWVPALPLTHDLARHLDCVEPHRLGIGQAGIRKISRQDFMNLVTTYHFILSGAARPSEAAAQALAETAAAEFAQMRALISANLIGGTIYTPTGKPNKILTASDTFLLVQSTRGQSEVPWTWIEEVYAKLRALGMLKRTDIQQGEHRLRGGYRSAFIFGLLAHFRHITPQTKPQAMLIFHEPGPAIKLGGVPFSAHGPA